MAVTLGGVPCEEPARLYRDCLDGGLSVAWASLPNAFECGLGTAPGEGWVLMSLSALRRLSPALDFQGLYDLRFAARARVGRSGDATLPSLVVCGCDCVTPGARGREAAYLVRLCDRRHFLGRLVVDRAFNLRHTFTGAFLPETGGDWTWEGAGEELWAAGASLLGAWPGLPFEPEGAPEDLEYYQQPLSRALDHLLGRLGCALAYNPLAASFSIVRPGDDDPEAAAALAEVERVRHWDQYPLRSTRAVAPASVRVLFRRLPHVRGESSPWYAVDVADAEARLGAGAEAGTVMLLEDDLEALYAPDGSGPTNAASLAARASERAADYYRALASGSDRLRLVLPFPVTDARLMPGPLIDSVRWSETAAESIPDGGMVTEIRRAGAPARPSWPDITIDPLTEIVRLTGEQGVTGGLLDGYLQRWEPSTRIWVDRGRIWVIDANAQ